MKLFSLLFLTIFMGKGCDRDITQNMETAVVEYTANTRGFYIKMIIQNQTVSISNDRNEKGMPKETKISDSDWKQLVSDFNTIDLDALHSLKAPSEKRFHDGAAIANLKVIYKGKTYESAPFDHGNPPEEIEKLVTRITSFSNKQ